VEPFVVDDGLGSTESLERAGVEGPGGREALRRWRVLIGNFVLSQNIRK
jgi:hypothetical protein